MGISSLSLYFVEVWVGANRPRATHLDQGAENFRVLHMLVGLGCDGQVSV